ncbi:MAG: methylaspartate mutase subunit E [Holophagales bacterium]|jgi:methylaspartate mutase epsilon subunit|nr:methylaspartate mutase subunit E [Holophagales bacterium]
MNMLKNKRLDPDEFNVERAQVLASWPTGADVNFDEGVAFHKSLPAEKRFTSVLGEAHKADRTLIQPRAGVALLNEHIDLLQALSAEADLLPTTIDAYTRQNQYEEAQKGIQRSLEAGRSLLNGFPAVNHGLRSCRILAETIEKPIQVRHGTPDARLLTEITLAAGFTSYEGGGISYNIPYAKKVSLEATLRHWQYADRLVGLYEEQGVRINREPFGPLTGSLVPPFISHAIAIIEGLLALEQGVKCLTLGYGQLGNLIQDVAAIASLRELADEAFQAAGYEGYQLTTVLHQWMGGFPEDESKAFSVIALGSAVAVLSKATKVIVKTPHEASGIPTKDANLRGLRATRQMVSLLQDQTMLDIKRVIAEKELIKSEVKHLLAKVLELGDGDVAVGTVRAFQAGVLDVPFAPSVHNAGKLMPVRDNEGAVRILDKGKVPMPIDAWEKHQSLVKQRADFEKREANYQMLIDDIYSVSKGRLVGRPR